MASPFEYGPQDADLLLTAWEKGVGDPDLELRDDLRSRAYSGTGGAAGQHAMRQWLESPGDLARKLGITRINPGSDEFWRTLYKKMDDLLKERGLKKDVRIRLRRRTGTLMGRLPISESGRLAVVVRFDGSNALIPVSAIDLVINAEVISRPA